MKTLFLAGLSALMIFPAVPLLAHDDKDKSVRSDVFVSNRGNQTMSLVRCVAPKRAQRKDEDEDHEDDDDDDGTFNGTRDNGIRCKEMQNVAVGFATSWPANQYRGNKHWWWTGLSGEVIGLRARNNANKLLKAKHRLVVDTYTYPGVPAGLPTSGSNFIGVTPKGKTAWNAAREIDEIQEIDANPKSPTFGQILTHIKVPLSAEAGLGSTTRGRMRPCDMSISPDGRYLWEPDLGGETITGVDIKTKQVVAQLTLPRQDPANRVLPFMLTTNGEYALVENFEAPFGTYSVIDVRDPAHPVHVKKITQADGLGISPMTSEFTPDGKYAYLITNGSPTTPGAIDVLDLETLQIAKKIALPDNCRPHTGDFTNDGGYFVVNCSAGNTVAVISNRLQEVVQQVVLSDSTPRGVIVR